MIEKERKFKLKYKPESLHKMNPVLILQGYLMLSAESGQQLRVRVIIPEDVFAEQRAYICYKKQIDSESKDEYEYEIPVHDGYELYDSCKYKLEKRRFSCNLSNNVHVDIDQYINPNMQYDDSSLWIVECEYANDELEIPDICGDEITGQQQYSNINIAIHGTPKG